MNRWRGGTIFLLRAIGGVIRLGRLLDQAEQRRCLGSQVKVGAAEQSGAAVTILGRSSDETVDFQIVEAAIESAHRLERAAGQQFAAGKNRGEGAGGVDRSGEGGEDSSGSSGKGRNVVCAMRCPEDAPRQVRSITNVLVERPLILVVGVWICVLRASLNLACNGKLRDMHVKCVHFEKWRTNA